MGMPYWMEPTDPWQEHCDYEDGARFDDVRERYASEVADLRLMDLQDLHHWNEQWARTQGHEELWWAAMLATVDFYYTKA